MLPADSRFKSIYIIGSELGDRLQQYRIADDLQLGDLWDSGCTAPIKLGATRYIALNEEEIRLLGVAERLPCDAMNVWIERLAHNRFSISYNLNFNNRLKQLEQYAGKKNIYRLPWEFKNPLKEKNDSIVIVRSDNLGRYNATAFRANSTSRYRSVYWVYQFALLQQLQQVEKGPFVFVITRLRSWRATPVA